MKDLQLYHRLPVSLRSLAASIYGYRLSRRRYGREFKRVLPGVIERMSWDRERLAQYADAQVRRLMKVVPHVPYYRERFSSCGIDPETIDSVTALVEEVLITQKSPMREHPTDFVDERLNLNDLIEVHTSGTTGTPLTLYRNRLAEGTMYAYFEGRWRMPYGVNYRSSWTMLGGKLVVPQEQEDSPFWVWNAGLNQRYMSVIHLAPKFASAYLKELRRKPTAYIYGYASALYLLARMVQEEGADDISFKVAISNAEPLSDYQRKVIAEVFHCPVRDTYGNAEWCLQGFECREGMMHMSADVGVFEILNENGSSCEPGEVGNVVCTSFLNGAQPLIRYRLGDRAVWSTERRCGCGCRFPVLGRVDGRCDDIVMLDDGRHLGRLDPIFKTELPIREAQVIQESFGKFMFVIVPAKGWAGSHERALRRQARSFLGDVHIKVEYVDQIPRDASGKFRAVVSRVKVADDWQ